MSGVSWLGTQLVCDVELMISDPKKTLAEGAITPWRPRHETDAGLLSPVQGALVKHFRVDDETPFADLPNEVQKALLFWDRWRADRDEI